MLRVEEKRAAVSAHREQAFARYEAWRREHEAKDPVLFTLDSLLFDIKTTGKIGIETWAQFDADEMTFLVENLNTRHTTPAEYRFNGTDIIVAAAQDNRPELTLRSIHEGGLNKSRQEAVQDSRYAFLQRRDELFMVFHDEIVAMMQGAGDADTLIKFSTFPIEALGDDRKTILEEKAFNAAHKMGFMYIARRLPGDRLQLLTIRLDDCTPDVVTECLRDYGFADAPLALEQSHEFGKYIVRLKTEQFPIKDIETAAVMQFDAMRCKVRNIPTSFYGRNEASIDAMDFLRKHDAHWAVYKAYNEQLARALNGEQVSVHILQFLEKSLAAYAAAGSSILSHEETQRVKQSLKAGTLEPQLARSYKKILFHTNVAYFKDLFEAYKKTGRIQYAGHDEHSMLGAYANSAADSGAAMAGRGESAAGCGLNIAVNAQAVAELAAQQGISLEEAARRLAKTAENEARRKKRLVPRHSNDRNYLIEKWGKENVKPIQSSCGACGKKRYVAICSVCPECDFKDTRNPGYITKLLKRRKRQQDSQNDLHYAWPAANLV